MRRKKKRKTIERKEYLNLYRDGRLMATVNPVTRIGRAVKERMITTYGYTL